MKPAARDFLNDPRKAVTLIGMSGVGKSHIANKLAGWGWTNYSCDHLIGTKYLKDSLSNPAAMKTDDIKALSEFVGQLGAPDKGGVDLPEFQRRQKLYYDAECQSVRNACEAIKNAPGHFVCDSSGSLCEITDPSILESLGKRSLFVYLKVRPENHATLLERANEYPKPLYFPPDFLIEQLERYKTHSRIGSVRHIDPVDFLRWIFPILFETRLSKYEALARRYGVTIDAGKFAALSSEEEFINIVAQSLENPA